MSDLAEQIYAELVVQTIFSGNGAAVLSNAEYTVMAAFAFDAAAPFYKYEELNDAERKRTSISCAAELAAAL